MIRLLSLTDLFPFLFFSLYSFQSADDVNGEEEEEKKKKKCLDVVNVCPSSKGENDEVHMYIYVDVCKTVVERTANIKKRRRLIINHEEQLVRKLVECTYFPKCVKDRQKHENEKIFEGVLQ
jgi:hypothetical protein